MIGVKVGVQHQRGTAHHDSCVVTTITSCEFPRDESPQSPQSGRWRTFLAHLAVQRVRDPYFHGAVNLLEGDQATHIGLLDRGRIGDPGERPQINRLTDGQRVIYSMPGGGAALPGLVDGRAYRVRVLDDYRIQLIDAATPDEVQFTGGNITGGNTMSQANTYTDGQAVQYVAPGSVGAFTSTRVAERFREAAKK